MNSIRAFPCSDLSNAPPEILHSLNPPPSEAPPGSRGSGAGHRVRFIRDLKLVPQLRPDEAEKLDAVSRRFAFRCNDYYLSLIDWSDPADPIRRIVIPCENELEEWGRLDASDEHRYTVAPGCEHKYPRVAVLLVSAVCGGLCRFCFRKRLFLPGNTETALDIAPGVDYIRKHTEITNVLVTGGDPLILSTGRLREILRILFDIPHVGIVRIGTKMLAFNPFRVLDDPALPRLVSEFSTGSKRLYFMTQFNHPRELTPPAREAIEQLSRANAILCNQTPLLRGINDDPVVLGELFRQLSFIGVPPYYVFQCRPTSGNRHFVVPLAQAFRIFEEARSRVGGLGKRGRFVMSHVTGKVEILAMTDTHFYMRYHRALDPADERKLLIFPRDETACWLDDLLEAEQQIPAST